MSVAGEVVIIGSGPYGLSVAAHLRQRGIGFRIFGHPMFNWHNKMPRGMLLKSDAYASNLSDPDSSFTLEYFCLQHGIPYQHEGLPVSLETFIAYGRSFQRRFVGELEERLVDRVERSGDGFLVRLDDGEMVSARRVVLAVGISDFAYLPPNLANLPAEFVSHSAQHSDLAEFAGRELVVIGGGSSAIDLTALLHEHGASVQLVTRRPELSFHQGPPPEGRTLAQRVRHPSTGIGPGWRSVFYTRTPLLFHLLPQDTRRHIVDTSHGPAASWFMRERILGQLPLLAGHFLQSAEIRQGRIHLRLSGPGGAERTLSAEQVIAATGYKVDLRAIKILGDLLRAGIKSVEHAPVLSRNFETSVSGFYVVGPAAAYSFGPMFRFVFGARFTAAQIARHIAGVASLSVATGAALPAK